MTCLTFTFYWKEYRLHLSNLFLKHFLHSLTTCFWGQWLHPHQFSPIHYILLWILTFQSLIFVCHYSLYVLYPHAYFKSNSSMIPQPYKSSPESILFIIQVLLQFLGLCSKYPLRLFCLIICISKQTNPYTNACIFSQALNNYYSSQTWSNWNPLWSVHHPFNESPRVCLDFPAQNHTFNHFWTLF